MIRLHDSGAKTTLVSGGFACIDCGRGRRRRCTSVACGRTVRTLFVLLHDVGAGAALVSSFRAIFRCGGRGPSVGCGGTVRT